MSLKIDSNSKALEFIGSFDSFLFDCDGVLWSGNHIIPNIVEFLLHLRSRGKNVIFVSNNSSKSRLDFKLKFDSLGIEASVNEIVGSSFASAAYLKNVLNFPSDKKVYVIGMKGIQDELSALGIKWTGGETETLKIDKISQIDSIKPDPEIGAVLCGLDLNISYAKYAKAFTYLHTNPDCHFIATNDDATFPAGNLLYPGAGSLSAVLCKALDRFPKVVGKPHQTMMDAIVANFKLDPARAVMIGDRLDTDIAFGKMGGLKTCLVLTGVTSEQTMLYSKECTPDYFIPSLGDLEVLRAL